MNRLFLVRHGENVANITKEFSHRLVDYDLTDKGRLQASQTAEYFRDTLNMPIDAIYSSPLKRAMQTADYISSVVGVPYEVLENFREINVGDLEKQPPTQESWDTYFRVSDAWYDRRMNVPFPGGETYQSLYHRFISGLKQATANRSDQNIIVVAHAGIFTFGIMELFAVEDRKAFDAQPNRNCSVTEILLGDDLSPIELVRWADGSHLSGEAAKIVASYPSREVGENVKERIK